jgi:hypothetical protein
MIGDHGGFRHDDTNVTLLVANPGFTAPTRERLGGLLRVLPPKCRMNLLTIRAGIFRDVETDWSAADPESQLGRAIEIVRAI